MNRATGVLSVAEGVGEGAFGGALLAAPEPTGLTKIAGGLVAMHGADEVSAGLHAIWSGDEAHTLTERASRAALP